MTIEYQPSPEFDSWWNANYRKLSGHSTYAKCSAIWNACEAKNKAAAAPAPAKMGLSEMLQSIGAKFLSPRERRDLLNGDAIEIPPDCLMAIINAALPPAKPVVAKSAEINSGREL